jgi:hypothetical protein
MPDRQTEWCFADEVAEGAGSSRSVDSFEGLAIFNILTQNMLLRYASMDKVDLGR